MRLKLLLSCLGALALTAAVGAGPAHAVEIEKFTITPSTTQAGGHPNVFIDAQFSNRMFEHQETKEDVIETGCNCQDVRDILLHMPTGFIGNPHAVPQCSLTEFALNKCSPDTQVGVVFITLFKSENPEITGYEEEVGEEMGVSSPVYNLQPHPGKPGAIGSVAPLIELPIETQLSARTGGDYGLDALTMGLFHILPIPRLSIYLWGNPADHEHDKSRFSLPHLRRQAACFGTLNDQVQEPENKKKPFGFGCHTFTPSAAANIPFLQNPTTCGVPLSSGLDLFYYENTLLHADHAWPATTGCDQLKFSPSLTAKPTTTEGDTASGMDIDLKAPQTLSPTVPSPSEVRSVKVTFPSGFSLSPPGADGKVACTDEQLNFHTEDAADCPEFSKVGTLTLGSSALPGPIDGAVYIGEPLPGQRFRVFLTADGFATHVKLKGNVHLDPGTGQIVTEFTDLPQAPFQDFNMHFFGAERGIFATPTRCGTYQVTSEFTPWASALPSQTSVATFDVESGPDGSPCPGSTRPFSPDLQAGTPDNTAGVASPLTIQLNRDDGEQNLVGLSAKLPTGLVGSLRGVTECPQAALDQLILTSHTGLIESATPACPASSQVGSVVSGAGAGTRNLYNPGKAFLAGPYRGSPLSLVVVVPAIGGPFDLGNVAIRAAIDVDPVTAQVSAVSDAFPLLVEGVPLRLRSVQLKFGRPGFIQAPTNCAPKSIDLRVAGDEGAVATPSAAYQVANCNGLPYAPKLSLSLSGGVKRRGHPALHAVFKAAPGEANTRSVSVSLPKGELLDNAHIGTVCTRVDFAKGACPGGSLLGIAEATTPLLDKPLKGNVYLRSNPEHELPDLVMDLRGQIDIELAGRIDTTRGGALRTTFESVPDAPVTQFKLDLLGGSKGLVQNSESLCGKAKVAATTLVGQNGTILNTKTKLRTTCGSKARHKRDDKRRRQTGRAVR